VEKGTLIIYELEQQIAGFIAFDIVGATLHLRYWFVHPTYRDRKIGSVLFRHFLYAGRNTRRQLFWVVSTNENALKRYRHYGFREEQLFNKVMTNI
jgi:ribosomal protein S18 acetylase RimI-like enzyme